MNGVGPASDTRRVLLVDKHSTGSEHLSAFLIVRSTANVTKASLQRSFHNSHGILGRIKETVPGRLECRLGLHNSSCELVPLRRSGPSRANHMGGCNRMMTGGCRG